MTSPATTASPSPQLASIISSSSPVIGLLREHHAGAVGVEQRLHHDADARPAEEPDALAVGDRRVGVRRPPDLAHRVVQLVRRCDVEQRQVLAGEARVRAVLVDRRRAHGERHGQRRAPARDLLDRVLLARRRPPRRSSPDSATPGGSGRPSRAASPSPTAFDPKIDVVARLDQRDDACSRRAPSPSRRHRRRARARRRRCDRSPRACRPRPGSRTRARRSPRARAARRCR